MDHTQFLTYFSVWTLLLAPVPIMRVRLRDHTATQVIVGGMLGAAYAYMWFCLVQWLITRYKNRLGKKFCGIVHNFEPLSLRIIQDGREIDGEKAELEIQAVHYSSSSEDEEENSNSDTAAEA
eukprot:TRINITY_DN75193_c0_g1_i1.p1 TRINITY_DN75193_c0_g1~~TRINITY_DN75193_c0_g1_i1.p1  ORF type:complete len:139 (-),score=5.43 TRINITY_DN75193_c0_g1_i1:41-409(-)